MSYSQHTNGSPSVQSPWNKEHAITSTYTPIENTFPVSLTLLLRHQSSLSQCCPIESCYICSREVNPCQPPVVIPIWVGHPQVIWCSYLIMFTLSVLFRVNWWGIHQCPPSTDLFLSMTTHYLGTWTRNLLVSWSLQSSVEGVLAFDREFTPLVPVRMTQGVFDRSTSIKTP